MKKRLLTGLVSGVVTVGLLAGCGAAKPDTTATNTKPIMVDTTIKTLAEPKDTTALLPHHPINVCNPNASVKPGSGLLMGWVVMPELSEPPKPEIRKLR